MQNLSTMEKEIFDTVSQKFGRFISDFKITIKPYVGAIVSPAPLCVFEFSYVALLDHSEQSVTDSFECTAQEVVERVWLSLIAVTQNSNENGKGEVEKHVVEVGESLGFVSPEHRMR